MSTSRSQGYLRTPLRRAARRGDGAPGRRGPGATVLPYCLSGGTDNKALSRLGITGYGFAPLRLPADLDFAAMFHGVDERVPLDSLAFGTRVMARFRGLLSSPPGVRCTRIYRLRCTRITLRRSWLGGPRPVADDLGSPHRPYLRGR